MYGIIYLRKIHKSNELLLLQNLFLFYFQVYLKINNKENIELKYNWSLEIILFDNQKCGGNCDSYPSDTKWIYQGGDGDLKYTNIYILISFLFCLCQNVCQVYWIWLTGSFSFYRLIKRVTGFYQIQWKVPICINSLKVDNVLSLK